MTPTRRASTCTGRFWTERDRYAGIGLAETTTRRTLRWMRRVRGTRPSATWTGTPGVCALRALPLRQREAIVLHQYLGLSGEQAPR